MGVEEAGENTLLLSCSTGHAAQGAVEMMQVDNGTEVILSLTLLFVDTGQKGVILSVMSRHRETKQQKPVDSSVAGWYYEKRNTETQTV